MQLAKPDYTVSIVTVKAGEDIPDVFLKKLITENQSCFGFAVQIGGKIEVDKFSDMRDEDVDTSYAKARKIVSNTKKFQRMFCFHSFPEEFDEAECQPWVIIKDSKGSPILVVALEGDLPGKGTEEGDSEMLGTISDYLGPKIEALFNLCGNDPKKLYASLKDAKLFGNDCVGILANRGHFFFMPTEGDIFAHGKENEASPQNGVFSWGAASFAFGYTEAAVEAATLAAPEPPAPKKHSKWEDDEPAKPAITTDPKTGTHTVGATTYKTVEKSAPEVEVPKVEPQPETDPVKIAAEGVVEGHWEDPPAGLHGKPLKKWYRDLDAKIKGQRKGDLIETWTKRPRVWVAHKAVVKTFPDLAQTAVGAVQKVEQPQLPVIDGPTQAKANEFLKKYLDGSSNQVPNPLELQKQEAKLAVFSELCRSLEDMERVSTATLLTFVETNPKPAWLYMIELRRQAINLRASLRAGDKKLGELTGTVAPETIPEPAKTPTAPLPEHAPPKKEFKYG